MLTLLKIFGFLFVFAIVFAAISSSTSRFAEKSMPTWLAGSALAALVVTGAGVALLSGKDEPNSHASIAVSPEPQSAHPSQEPDTKTLYLQNYQRKGDTVELQCRQEGREVKCGPPK
ncbi:hypothetical protein [Cupriavidus basilensis]|uniref:hypothetical protein n=1 Tax=Cupriavidus basilensis TaxID=68895 RepID=UPI00284632DE|nr:hypothetical protein [Cupriavidus basilensis]MDR3381723.1 hypothetical protein [Cupriavidus basilensis]